MNIIDNHEWAWIDSEAFTRPVQTQITTYTIMEYIKSHNLSLEDIQSLSQELSGYSQQMIINSLSAETKIELLKKEMQKFWQYINFNKPTFNKEFDIFLNNIHHESK